MSKKSAILITIGVVIATYAFILFALPAMSDMITTPSPEVITVITDYHIETPTPPTVQFYNDSPLPLYILPGILGAIIVILISIQKGEAKQDE